MDKEEAPFCVLHRPMYAEANIIPPKTMKKGKALQRGSGGWKEQVAMVGGGGVELVPALVTQKEKVADE